MGLLLMRERPGTRVLIVERSAVFDFKVGESTSEVAGAFLTRVLRIGSWLSREQIAKNGLRFWFTSPGNECVGRCAEIGPKLQVRLPAYQLDRSKLDAHVLELAREAGCEVRRSAVVRNLELQGTGKNRLTVSENGNDHPVTARWVIDASGRAAVIARHRGTLENLDAHPTSSLWCRFTNVSDLDAHELSARYPDMEKRVWSQRSNATNHLTGDGGGPGSYRCRAGRSAWASRGTGGSSRCLRRAPCRSACATCCGSIRWAAICYQKRSRWSRMPGPTAPWPTETGK